MLASKTILQGKPHVVLHFLFCNNEQNWFYANTVLYSSQHESASISGSFPHFLLLYKLSEMSASFLRPIKLLMSTNMLRNGHLAVNTTLDCADV